MSRKRRVEAPGAIQHVIARGNAGGRIVLDDDDRLALVGGLARVSERCGWRVHAFCLMDTHVHMVIETSEPTLGTGMRRLLGGYAYEFNRRHGRYGLHCDRKRAHALYRELVRETAERPRPRPG